MMPSTRRRHVLLFVAGAGLALPLAYFFAKRFVFWVLVGLTALNVIFWSALAVAQLVNRIRFGAPMTFDEIMREQNPTRMVRLIRYHLGWSPAKIAAELNRLGVTNHGLPWREDDVRQVVKYVNSA